jgi:hypothetical protein
LERIVRSHSLSESHRRQSDGREYELRGSGSHLAGVFGRCANIFEKEVRAYVARIGVYLIG